MPRIIVLDTLAREGLDQLAAAGIDFDVRTGLKGAELREALTEYEGAICRSGVKLDAAALQGNRRLRAIVRAGVGTDNIDKSAATRQGIVVMNTPAGNTLSTAEHTFALLLALSRNIAPAYQSLQEGRWERNAYMGTQLADKTLGIVGLGRIGQEVAKRAQAFGMRVVGFDPFLSPERASDLGIRLVSKVDQMLPDVDYLTVHTPLTDETRHLISGPQLAVMRPGVRLINCARGGIYDEVALLEGLEKGQVAGVALDVFETEPCTQSPLFGKLGVLCTPHLGASTEEAQTQVAVEAVGLLVNFLRTGEIRHAVNMSAVDPQTLQALRGYLDAAHRLGLLLAQWHSGNTIGCHISYRGEVTSRDTHLITSAFAAGFLQQAMAADVNIVNAQLLMQERGIEISVDSSPEKSTFSSSLTVEVKSDRARYVAGATLFGQDMPRLIRLQDYRLEAYLDGVLFIFTHDDVPGIIGAVGTIFGAHKVNIAQMTVGRAGPAGSGAVGVLNLDSRPTAAALEEVLRHPHIHSGHVIVLPPFGQLAPWLQA